ncbi:twin-arginine translocase subunit TatC [Haloarchaeobius salinus]|uniref:twin-arginine translocase subunit TatC n=1 Tax=Haloarchaeobius salinus TaxID=1198298 RepID=UPI0021097EDF|nr:twin-arginine translocase subunit TatC [Haloarchaeobius salinus]
MSSVIGEDTARTINSGRETAGVMLRALQKHLQKVFIVFLVGMLGTIYSLRLFIWEFLQQNTQQRMPPEIALQVEVIARTPFDVILLQFKIGVVVGALLALPLLLYFAKDSLARRGFQPEVPLSRWQIGGIVGAVFILFVLGIIYAYVVFFPFMFEFLATNAVNASIKPSYDITMWTEFIVFLTFSFGLAAQLPLMMSSLSYVELVSYEFWRDNWRYAFLIIFVFGALFSPPDPFTQIMWAIPLISLYVLSLGFAKVVTNLNRAGGSGPNAPDQSLFRRRMYQLIAIAVVSAAGTATFFGTRATRVVSEQLFPAIPSMVRPGPLYPTSDPVSLVVVGLQGAFVLAGSVLVIYTLHMLRQPVVPKGGTRPGDPTGIDVGQLDAAGVQAAPPEVFMEMSEEEAVGYAREAMDADEPDKAEAVLNRFDEAEEAREAEEAAQEEPKSLADPTSMGMERNSHENHAEDEAEEGGFLSRTTAGVVDPFTEDETTEEDIGGYYYDVMFIFESITSKLFRVVGLFMVVMFGSFYWLYTGGLGDIKRNFIKRIPPAVRGDPAAVGFDTAFEAGKPLMDAMTVAPGVPQAPSSGPANPGAVASGQPYSEIVASMGGPSEVGLIVALHPVEALIFEVKVSFLLGVAAALPVFMYYAWPAMKERGIVSTGENSTFLVWGVALFVGFVIGSVLGYFIVAPTIISYLVADAIQADMVISYRLKSFFWLIFFTTLGIGIFIDIIVTMLLFHWGNIVKYRTFREFWRPIVVSIFLAAALFSPSGVLTMLVLSIPIAMAYLLGLGLLSIATIPWRLRGGGGGGGEPEEPAAEEAA